MARLLNKLSDIIHLKKHSSMQSQKLLIGALAGLVAGVAVGLLLAPASGRETRQKIANSAGDLGDNLKKRFRKLTGKEAINESDPWTTQNAARSSASTPNWQG